MQRRSGSTNSCNNFKFVLLAASGRAGFTRTIPACRAAARGSAFTLRAFHDAVLPYGGLPVTLIRWGLGLGE